MDSMREFLYYLSLGVGFFAAFCFLVFMVLYVRKEQRDKERLRQTKADIADTMLLFQTMRDVVSQQKELAKDFNAKLEQKLGVVKQVIQQGLEKNERLFERQQALTQQLEETRAELESVQRQVAHLQQQRAALSGEAPPAPAPETNVPEESGESIRPVSAPPAAEKPQPFVSLPPRPEPPASSAQAPKGDPFAEWPNPPAEEAPEHSLYLDEQEPEHAAPEAPEDAESARDAFRALLDLPESGAADTANPGTGGNQGHNGRSEEAPIQQRVVDYNQAGMSVAEIARELGIGKGEVRLMLSLHKEKGS